MRTAPYGPRPPRGLAPLLLFTAGRRGGAPFSAASADIRADHAPPQQVMPRVPPHAFTAAQVTINRGGSRRLGFDYDEETLVVTRVARGGGAEGAGVLPGWRVVSIDGRTVRSAAELAGAAAAAGPEMAVVFEQLPGGPRVFRAVLATLEWGERRKMGLAYNRATMAVMDVAPGRAAAAARVAPGMRILSVGGRPVRNGEEFAAAAAAAAASGPSVELLLEATPEQLLPVPPHWLAKPHHSPTAPEAWAWGVPPQRPQQQQQERAPPPRELPPPPVPLPPPAPLPPMEPPDPVPDTRHRHGEPPPAADTPKPPQAEESCDPCPGKYKLQLDGDLATAGWSMHSGPSRRSSKKASLSTGTEVTVVAVKGSWLRLGNGRWTPYFDPYGSSPWHRKE